jgi:hypothetical protein
MPAPPVEDLLELLRLVARRAVRPRRPLKILTAGDSDAYAGEDSRQDGDVPAARVAALQQQRPRWDKSTGHEQSDQEADRPAVRSASRQLQPRAPAR